MAILGIFTDLGISKAIDAESNAGFKIHPMTFGVSRDIGTFATSRTAPNAGMWYQAAISSAVKIDQNTVKIVCTIPQNASLVNEDIKEIYIFGEDEFFVEYLLCLGQPTEVIRYDIDGTTTLELQMSLVNVDLTDNMIFNNTMAIELEEHESDPNAHPEIAKALAKHGIFIPLGSYPFNRRGQSVEFPVEFAGTNASFTHGGVTFTATYNGTELNTKTIVFDGIKSVDVLRAEFNAINYPDTVEHNGVGTEVLSAITKTLVGGTYLVDEGDFVYKDVDGLYKQALADGSNKSNVAGWAIRSDKTLVVNGLIDLDTGFAINTPVYLSGTLAGKSSAFNTNINLGICLGDYMSFTGFAGDISTNVSQEFDAVVTDAAGVGQYATTQLAINAIPDNGRILVAKLEDIKETIETGIKNFTVVFNNPNTGWRKFAGQSTVIDIDFSAVPTQGTWRMEWNGQETNDLAYNANAATIQTEFNLLNGHNGVVVTGNYTSGFTITFSDNQLYPLPTFVYVGRNEIQRFDFSAVPDNGTTRFEFESVQTVNYAFNDSLQDLEDILNALSTIQNVNVTGSFAAGFVIEFQGGYLQDGLQPQQLIKAVTDFLYASAVQVQINGSIIPPINAVRTQDGKTPASNLYNGITPIVITPVLTQSGEESGPDRLMNVENEILLIQGFGLVEDFTEGFRIDEDNEKFQVELHFNSVDKPFLSLDKLPGINYDSEILGRHKDVIAQLRSSEHPTNKKRVKVSGVDFEFASGVLLTKELNGLKVKFEGAELDFSTGTVYDADGITDIGISFSVPTVTPGMWQWFAVNLVADSVNVPLNEVVVNISVIPALGEGATKLLAPKAAYSDSPVGQVAIQGALGDIEQTVITTVKDTFSQPLFNKTFILYHPLESVAFYFNTGSVPALALTADRAVAINTLVANDFQATVATKIKNAIDADVRFTATVIGNKVTVLNTTLGDVTDADMGDTGFFSNVTVQGTDTDPSGLEDISNYDFMQLSAGSGGGGNLSVRGTMVAPLEIDETVGIEVERSSRQLAFISSQSGEGAQEITANPQIEAGTSLGQELILVGTSDTDYIKLVSGSGLYLSSPRFLKLNQIIRLIWSGLLWVEADGAGFGLPQLKSEVPAGVVNGINTVFTIAEETVNGSLILWKDGVYLKNGTEYTLVGQTLTLTVAPEAGMGLEVWYFVQDTNTSGVRGKQEIAAGLSNGVNLDFTLTEMPFAKSSMILFIDGRKELDSRWSLIQTSTTSTIKFNVGAAPEAGSTIEVFYLINIAQSLALGGGGGGGGDGALTVHGFRNAPIVVTTSGLSVSPTEQRMLYFIKAPTSAGEVLIDPGLQISAGTIIGQELIIVGTDDNDYIRLIDLSGLEINGPINLKNGIKISFFWDGFLWSELSRP